jgi:hypothetical protein
MSNSLIPYNDEVVPRKSSPFYNDPFLISPVIFPTPESPETAIARGKPSTAFKLLKEMSKDRLSEKALETAAIISHSYLSNLPKERLTESKGVRVSFERQQRFFSGKEYGFILNIDLK